jgi:hypothetical protein
LDDSDFGSRRAAHVRARRGGAAGQRTTPRRGPRGKRQYVVIEVNDNPSIWAGCEDAAVGDALYDAIMGEFLRRLEARSAAKVATAMNGTSEEPKDARGVSADV